MEVSGSALGLYMLGIVALVFALIYGFRYILKQRFSQDFKEKYAAGFSSPLKGRAKYPDVDTFSNTGVFFRFGLAVPLAVVLLAMSWTQYETAVYIPDDAMELDLQEGMTTLTGETGAGKSILVDALGAGTRRSSRCRYGTSWLSARRN